MHDETALLLVAGCVIRIADRNDVEQLRSFRCRTPGSKYTHPVQECIREDFVEALETGEDALCVHVAVDELGVVVGVVGHLPVLLPPGTHPTLTAHTIPALGVVPERRRERIGISLKETVLVELSGLGVDLVVSDVHRTNQPMLKLNATLSAETERNPDDGEYLVTVARVPDA